VLTFVTWIMSSVAVSIVVGTLLYIGGGSPSRGPRRLRDGSGSEPRELHGRVRRARLHEGVKVIR
jgi:hypothetical protein